MPVTRRQFLWSAAASAGILHGPADREYSLWSDLAYAQSADNNATGVFRHGVASGDPLTDRVILWTRVTPPGRNTRSPVEVRWRIGSDPSVDHAVGHGTTYTTQDRDFTVKVDAGELSPGRPYYYRFESLGEESPVGRTRTLPSGNVDRIRLASVCCSNYPTGYFNVYRCVANRADLDAVLHVGDYIYEFENGPYANRGFVRIPEPRREAVTLSDYRIRYATHRTDPDLQEAHRMHPFIAVWDDHEMANDAWSGGATNHNPERGEGSWASRKAAAYRAYLEWMPIRESTESGIHLYRSFRFGSLVDLLMLDTRGLRDRQVGTTDLEALVDTRRTILGPAQEGWLFDELRSSRDAETAWRVLGQQVMFSRVVPPGRRVVVADTWEGYQASRDRVLDFLDAERIKDVAILSGDLHSSWAFDVARNPWDGYKGGTGEGSLAVELLTPAISSPPLFANSELRQLAPLLRSLSPHLKFLDGDSRGYIVLDITKTQLRGDWYFVPSVTERSADETRAAAFVCERGSAHLAPA